MKALIDADILPYEFGGMVQLEEPDKPLAWDICRSMVDVRIKQILRAVGAEETMACEFFLTDSASNFRLRTATIKPYKGNRKQEKPYHWERVRQHIIDNWIESSSTVSRGCVCYGIEADDRLGIEQYTDYSNRLSDYNYRASFGAPPGWELDFTKWCNTVICSRDKDLHMIPGWHYTWECGNQKERLWFQDETEALRCFYRQLLTGDSTDNILGLYGVGTSSSLVKKINECEQEEEMFEVVYKAYQDRFGSYAWIFLLENASLLWILREDEDFSYNSPEEEIHNRLHRLLDAKEKEKDT